MNGPDPSQDDFVLLHLLIFPDLAKQAVRAVLKRVEIFNALRCPHCKLIWDHYLFCANRVGNLSITKSMQMVEYVDMLRRTPVPPEVMAKAAAFLRVFATTPKASLKMEEGRAYLRSIIQADASRKAVEAIKANPEPEYILKTLKTMGETTNSLLQDSLAMADTGLIQPLKCLGSYLGLTEKIPYGIDYLDEITYGGISPGTTTAIIGPTGGGKCLAKGTLVLMYSGELKKVEEVVVGDLVMGPDSTPRRVLSLGRGRDIMYRVKPVKGESWVCNSAHLLTVEASDDVKVAGKQYHKGIRDEITAEDYFRETSKDKKSLQLVRTGIDFPEIEEPEIDPYAMGLHLASSNTPEDRIPAQYKLGSRVTRVGLLVGFLTVSFCEEQEKERNVIVVSSEEMADDVAFVARSLGCLALKRKEKDGEYRIHFFKGVLHTGFELEQLPEDDYYGFTLDGDSRFVLGDFTITHNTMTAISIVMAQAMQTNYTLWLTYEQSLMGDLAERLTAKASGAPLPSVRDKSLQDLPEAAIEKLEEMTELFGEYLFVRDFSQPLKDGNGIPLDESKQRIGCAADIIELIETLKRIRKKPKLLVLDWLGEMVAMIAAERNMDAEKDFRSIAIPELKILQSYCKQEGIALIIFHQLLADLNNAPPSRIPNKNEAMNWKGLSTRMDQSLVMGTMRGAQVCWLSPGKNRTGKPILRKIRLDGDNVRFVPADEWVIGPNGDFINPDEPIPDVNADSSGVTATQKRVSSAYGKPIDNNF